MDPTPNPKKKLKGMLARIFSDANVEENEREELRAYLGSGQLTHPEIREVLTDFVATTWKITMADGVISDTEKKRLRNIVSVLGMRDVIPTEWAAVLDE
jgi:hypothetical protein